MMIWWNWEKLEMEKYTLTMLMHRYMERFISSRIMRARVCSNSMQHKAMCDEGILDMAASLSKLRHSRYVDKQIEGLQYSGPLLQAAP